MKTWRRWALLWFLLVCLAGLTIDRPARGEVTRADVERAIRDGVRFLLEKQRGDGSWADIDTSAQTGTTSLVVLALLTAGEAPDSPKVEKALRYLQDFGPDQLRNTYAVALQTMAFCAADPTRYRVQIAANVTWLEEAQIKAGDHKPWPGSWAYSRFKTERGDSSISQYALLALNAAAEAGVPVKGEVWTLARHYWEWCQRNDGGWPYVANIPPGSTASMTCAGISSLIITGLQRFRSQEHLQGDVIRDCGRGATDEKLEGAIDWLAGHFSVAQNHGNGQRWKYYYLYGLERAGRLSGQRFFGKHDWYREGAEELVGLQDRLSGHWRGMAAGEDHLIATSFALLFLAKGRAPVLVNKLRYGPGRDWNNDADDVRNLVNFVSRDWKHLLTWQIVNPEVASVENMLQAPIAFFSGHESPVFDEAGRKTLRAFVDQGGFIFADACCGRDEFDRGFRALMEAIFPGDEFKLHRLADDHAIWRAKHALDPDVWPLWGIEHGCRTVVVYSPKDLSCYWNQAEKSPGNDRVILAQKVGQNVIEYATGRELPADKLIARRVVDLKPEGPKRGALHIAKLRHAGDWNVAPLAVPNLTNALRQPPLNFDVVINHKELSADDDNLIYYPLVYVHGRAALSFGKGDLDRLRRHLDPGGGILFADAACGSPAFDVSFRRVVAELFPKSPLVAIPHDDAIYTKQVAFDLAKVQYSKAAGGGQDYPALEGVKINGRWAIIYSKYDIGCALERHQGIDCKGYTYESALKIAANLVIYSTLP